MTEWNVYFLGISLLLVNVEVRSRVPIGWDGMGYGEGKEEVCSRWGVLFK
jgi:hypothetical protein